MIWHQEQLFKTLLVCECKKWCSIIIILSCSHHDLMSKSVNIACLHINIKERQHVYGSLANYQHPQLTFKIFVFFFSGRGCTKQPFIIHTR